VRNLIANKKVAIAQCQSEMSAVKMYLNIYYCNKKDYWEKNIEMTLRNVEKFKTLLKNNFKIFIEYLIILRFLDFFFL
jgi:hypothetical protein